MRAGLASLIAAQTGLALAAQPEEADVVVADGLPEGSEPGEPPTIALTETQGSDFLRQGYGAVLPRETNGEELAAAIRGVAAGLAVMDRATLGALLGGSQGPPSAESSQPLTPREREVIRLLAGGLGNKEIAGRLNISEHTVKFHVAAILQKLNAASRAEAVAIGMRSGLILL